MRNKIATEWKALIFLLKPAWKYGRGYMITSLLINLICEPTYTLLFVGFIQAVVNAFTSNATLKDVLLTAFLYQFGITMTVVIRKMTTTLYHSKVHPKFCAKIEAEVYKKSVMTDYRFMDDSDYFNKYTWTLQNYIGKVEDAIAFLETLCRCVTVISALMVSIASNDIFVILISIITLIVSNIVTKKQGKINHEIGLNFTDVNRRSIYVDRVYYMRDVSADMRCSRLPNKITTLFENNVKKRLEIVDNTKGKECFYEILKEFISLLLQLTIVFYLCFRINAGIITIGSFAGLIYASDALKINISHFLGLDASLNDFRLFYESVKEFFDIKSVIEQPEEPPKANTDEIIKTGEPISIKLEHVCFAYNNAAFSLKDINMDIKAGEKIAIVGFNGAGKSTLIKLLLRLYDADSGKISVNGCDIKDYDVHKFRSHIGIAFQNTNLYALPLRDNLTLLDDADDETIKSAMHYFELDSVLEKSNATLDTEVTKEFTDEGIMLSGGELQKLALIRVFMKDYGLLILDEPSSALDPIAEYNLNQKIFNMSSKATTILISHRLTSARNADRIYLFENGSIAEYGSHDELMAKKGQYYDMFTKQAESYQMQEA